MPRRRIFVSSIPRDKGETERVNVGRSKERVAHVPRTITIGLRSKVKEWLQPLSRNS